MAATVTSESIILKFKINTVNVNICTANIFKYPKMTGEPEHLLWDPHKH